MYYLRKIYRDVLEALGALINGGIMEDNTSAVGQLLAAGCEHLRSGERVRRPINDSPAGWWYRNKFLAGWHDASRALERFRALGEIEEAENVS